MAGNDASSAICVPPAVNSQSPNASGHCIARSVGSTCRARMNDMAPTHSASNTHSHAACSTQKNGRLSRRTSRSVPPPNAASPETTHTPTTSRRLRAPSMRPESAKAKVATASMVTWAFDSVQNERAGMRSS